MQTTEYDLTVIIVNWNAGILLRDCIRSIYASAKTIRTKIVVVDNQSSDESCAIVRGEFPDVLLIESGANIGFSRGVNLGLSSVSTQFVMFLNPDTLVMDNTIDHLVNHLKFNSRIGAIGCKSVYLSNARCNAGISGMAQSLPIQWNTNPVREFLSILGLNDNTARLMKKILPYHDPNVSGFVRKIPGSCIVMSRTVLDAIGNFDERFYMYGEDADLNRRILRAGWRIYYTAETELVHYVGASSRSIPDRSTRLMCESISKLIGKYGGPFACTQYWLVMFFGSVVRLSVASVLHVLLLCTQSKKSSRYHNAMRKYIVILKWTLSGFSSSRTSVRA
jgi:O-antigen biosynthesis protein